MSEILEGLTDAQRDAVTHINGPLLVIAGPGSGKTRVITRRIAYLAWCGIRPWNILAITFTNKAAGEMRDRVASLSVPKGVWLSTFHSYCARVLREFAARVGYTSDFVIYDEDDSLKLISDIMKESEISRESSFDKETPMLHQSLATNLLSEEFLPPVFTQSDVVHWVGSIWNDANNHGNIENIGRLEQALAKNHLHFESHKGVSDEENVNLIRASRIAPAIGGGIQVKRHMMPCRVWKNISYGQACVTNLPKALEVFPSGVICNRNIG